ncbi:alpha-humulene synthase-like [Humulus lupulus]|uniref:alpha-humulene synthase-like n=1 Tax=Humulus lupulus TaxID=3486 RepID=UPI002B4181BC|nr:alpha-humulene synthase-like [Humulus lupulus]
MSNEASASSQNVKILHDQVIRPTANYHPAIWGDQFLHYTISEQELEYKQKRVEELKELVKKEIFIESTHDGTLTQLKLIDDIQRLGLSYHFECEIEQEIEHVYRCSIDQNNKEEDLYDASIRFRLLRQHGYKVSSNIFEKFKNEDGTFESLVTDIPGMLSLYEASYLSFVGENILDEALAFTTKQLELLVANKKTHPLSDEISLALKRPIRKTLERLDTRHYISIFENNEASHRNKVLLELAKLDFNLLQSMHRTELSKIVRWWKELDIAHKLPFARDRIVELYFWILGVYYEPQYSLARNIAIKTIALTSIADDIYDAHGTFDELKLLTEAIDRWDIKFMDNQLIIPEYLQTFYKLLLNCYEEFNKALEKEESFKVHCGKEEFKRLLRAYFHEAQWLNQGYIPSFDEHVKVSLIFSGYSMVFANCLIGMKDIVTNEVIEWLSKDPKIIKASSIICRFMNDIVSHKFEQERGHSPSTVECYMKQYGVSEQEAYDELNNQVDNAWKEINEEFIRPTDVPLPILVRALNLSRVIDLLYKDGDGYTHVGKVTKDSVAALLIDPIPL